MVEEDEWVEPEVEAETSMPDDLEEDEDAEAVESLLELFEEVEVDEVEPEIEASLLELVDLEEDVDADPDFEL